MPNGKKKKGHKMATHKRKKRLRKNRHKSLNVCTLRQGVCRRARFTRLAGMPRIFDKLS